jgi:Flp pilus assembly protein TadG
MIAILKRLAGRPHKQEDGQSLVEFALVVPVFLLVLFAIVDFGMAFHAWITVTNSAREGGRLGSVHASAAAIEQRVRDTADTLDQDNLSVTVTNADDQGGQPGESVVVDVSYSYSLMTPLADLLNLVSGGTIPDTLSLDSVAEMRLE